MIAESEAVPIARAAAGDAGYAVEEMHVVTVIPGDETWEVLLGDGRYARGGGVLVRVDMTTGRVTDVTPQL